MPTGYTDTLYKGEQEFEEFVLHAAHAFLPEMYDRDKAVPIERVRQPSAHAREKVAEAIKERARIESLSTAELKREAANSYNRERRRAEKDLEESKATLDRYEAMRSRVERWEVPSDPDADGYDFLNGLKAFMLEQLLTSIQHDCHIKWAEDHLRGITKLDPEEYRASLLDAADRDIKYYSEEFNRSVERTDARNKDVAVLLDSLEGASV